MGPGGYKSDREENIAAAMIGEVGDFNFSRIGGGDTRFPGEEIVSEGPLKLLGKISVARAKKLEEKTRAPRVT